MGSTYKDMIENFRWCTKEAQEFEPRLSPNTGESIFGNLSSEAYRQYFDAPEIGLTWELEGTKVTVIEGRTRIYGLPDPQMLKVIAVYPSEHNMFPAPQNCVIYNADGTIYMRLKQPELISKPGLEQKKRIKPPLTPSSIWYDKVSWQRDNAGKVIAAVTIGFVRQWFEIRTLNVENGELGECHSYGMF